MTRRLALIPAAAALLAAQLASAQSTPEVNQLGVVEVTGQSRVQQLLDVPITLKVISNDLIKGLGASNLGSLEGFIPGLSIDASQPTQPIYTMRGIGTGDFGIGTDSPVGVYVNGVYTGKTGGALLNFNDVKRIEVLKGPQGTLFGRNAAGGAISIINNDPVLKREASGLVRLGNQGIQQTELLYNDSLSDSTAFRMTAVRQHKDGWVRNSVDGSKAGGENDWGTRLALRWSGEETSVTLAWEHERLNQKARPVWSMVAAPTFPVDPATWTDPRRRPLANDASPNVEARSFDGVTLRIERSTPIGEFTSLTAYRKFNAKNIEDNDGTALRSAYLSTGNIETNRTLQQEFRLNGKTAGTNWVAGISAYSEHATQNNQVNTFTDALDSLLLHNPEAGLAPYATVTGIAQMLGLTNINLLGQSWQENMFSRGDYKAFAAFGDVIWKLGDATNVTTGIRFTRDDKRFSWFNPLRNAAGLDAQLSALNAASFFPTLVGMGVLAPEQAGALQFLMSNNLEFTNPSSAQQALGTRAAWNDVSPRLVFDHHLDRDTMLFASATRGYQAGGFNSVNVLGTYQPERVTNYEAGAKGTAGRLFYSAALFHYDFTNLQNLTLVPASVPTGVPAYQVTVSDQQATGLDLETQLQIDRTWRLSGSAEFIDQKYKHYNAPGTDANLAGQPVGTPRVSLTAGIEARMPLAGGNSSFGLNWAYVGAQRCNADSVNQGSCVQTPSVRVGEATTRVDLRLGWESADRRWGTALIVNNLLDKQYVRWTSMLGSPMGSPYGWISPPRAVMLELSARI